MKPKYELYLYDKMTIVLGPVTCSECSQLIEPVGQAIYIEGWSRSQGFSDGMACSPECSLRMQNIGVRGQRYPYVVMVVSTIPKGSVRKFLEPPVYGGRVDLQEASAYHGGEGEYRWHSNASKVDFMDMKGQKPLIPAQDAKGVSLSDLRSAQAEGRLPTMEEDLAELDLIFTAVPIDAHSQVEGSEKKRLEDSR